MARRRPALCAEQLARRTREQARTPRFTDLECNKPPQSPDINSDNCIIASYISESASVSHSHIPVNHLLKQLEIRRAQRESRDLRPVWLTELINRTVEFFEPLSDVARVGYDCRATEDMWQVGLYLGTTEVVGGSRDGQSRPTNFQFDLSQLLDLFSSIERFHWYALPDAAEDDEEAASSYVLLEGHVGENPVRMLIHSVPPTAAGPGFRSYPDGSKTPV